MLFETGVNGTLSNQINVSLISQTNLVKKNFALTLSVVILISDSYSANMSNLMTFFVLLLLQWDCSRQQKKNLETNF